MKIKVDEKNLETAIKKVSQKNEPEEKSMSKDEEVGFHKGSLNTLFAERNELIKMIGTVESIMQAHVKRLQELGIKLEQTRK